MSLPSLLRQSTTLRRSAAATDAAVLGWGAVYPLRLRGRLGGIVGLCYALDPPTTSDRAFARQSPTRLAVPRSSNPAATLPGSVWTNVYMLPSGAMKRS